jgi:hypothetical protein
MKAGQGRKKADTCVSDAELAHCAQLEKRFVCLEEEAV